jgi:hypothetical protein
MEENTLNAILVELRELKSAVAKTPCRDIYKPQFGVGCYMLAAFAVYALAHAEVVWFVLLVVLLGIYWQIKKTFLHYKRRRDVTGRFRKIEEYDWWYESEEKK